MILNELYDRPVQGYQDVTDDNSKLKWKDSRKSKLTLRQISKLRKMLDVRSYEKAQHLKKVRKQYQPSQDAQPGL